MKGNKDEMNNKKSSKRKFLAATLGALIVVNIVSVCDFSVVKFGNFSANLNDSDNLTMDINDVDEETMREFENRIDEGILNLATKVETKDLTISNDVVIEMMDNFIAKHPEYSYVNYSFTRSSFKGDEEIKYSKRINLSYDDIEGKIAALEDYTNSIISKTADMSDLEKALYIHDRIALDFGYDTRIHSSDDEVKSAVVFNIYDFIEQKTGVCEAYSKLYKYILTKAGIPARLVTSSQMGHMWNVIQIDGNWYHVDLTWDDPEPDRKGTAMHNNFLLSDSAIGKSHSGWEFTRGEEVECSDTSYDSAWWENVSTEIFYLNNKWFSINDNGEFLEIDVKSGEQVKTAEAAFTVERDTWYAWNSDNYYWKGNYTTLVNNGDEFFYNTSENVYSINMDGSNKKLVASFPKAEHNGFQIYGLAVDENNMLYVNLQNNPQETEDSDGNVVPVSIEKVVISDIATASASGIAVESTAPAGKTETISFIDWQGIKDMLTSDKSVEISMSDKDNSLPAEIVKNVMGKDLDIIIDMDTYKWTINGLNVSSENIADVALGVSENLGIIPENVNDMYIDDQKTVEVNLDHEGQFGYDATLSIYVGKEYASKIASVLHYKEDTGILDYQDSVVIDDEGYANITLCHASSYMVVVDDKIVGLPGDINSDGVADLKDFVTLKQYLVGKFDDVSSLKIANTDMNSDGRVSINDAVIFGRNLIANK